MTLEAQGLTRRFVDGSYGLNDLNLQLSADAFTVISGHNGSGKSLLLRHLVALEMPDAGRITLDGRPLEGCLPELRRALALVFQEPEHQILGVSVAEDLAYGPRCSRRKPAEYQADVAAALQACGLRGMEQHLTSALSGGEKRRLALASTLVAKPELLLLDEPFNDLDWQGASDLLHILLKLRKQGTGILIVTHDLEKCLAHADRLIVLDAGRVVRDGTPTVLWDELPALGLRRLPGGSEQIAAMTWLKP